MTDLSTLSRLLASQEERDGAPCVPFKKGHWHILRSGAIQYPHLHAETNKPEFWNPDGSCKHGSSCDIIWSGDLPALLSELVAENARLREGIAKARMEISGGLCYFTKEAKHAQLKDADTTLAALEQQP